jgi:hypothetical protein
MPYPALLTSIATVAMLATTGPAVAGDFTLVIHESPAQLALRSDPGARGTAYWQGFAAAGAALAKSGALKGGAALEPRAAATIGSGTGPTPSGYFVITAPDVAAAKKLAALIPAARSGRVEIIAHAAARTGM